MQRTPEAGPLIHVKLNNFKIIEVLELRLVLCGESVGRAG